MKIPFDYKKEIDNKYIVKRRHPKEHDLVILNYTKKTVYEKHWNEVTLSCRGLIIRESTGDIIARPFTKFFNYNEDVELKHVLQKGKPSVSLKLDGSLGISYPIHGTIQWATRGSFDSPQAKIANRIWQNKYSHISLKDIGGITLLTEIIDPKTKVLIDYGDVSELYLIGAIRIEDGHDFSVDELSLLAKKLKMKTSTTVDLSFEKALNLRNKLDHQTEGWVFRWEDGTRLKVKTKEYLRIHRMIYGLTEKKIVYAWAKNRIKNLTLSVPEEFRNEIERLCYKLDSIERKLHKLSTIYHKRALSISKDKNVYSAYIKKQVPKPYKSFCYSLYHNKAPHIKKYIYHHYDKFFKKEI